MPDFSRHGCQMPFDDLQIIGWAANLYIIAAMCIVTGPLASQNYALLTLWIIYVIIHIIVLVAGTYLTFMAPTDPMTIAHQSAIDS